MRRVIITVPAALTPIGNNTNEFWNALVAVEEAVQDARINFEKLNRNRIGVIWGSGNGGINTFEQQVTEFAKGVAPRFNPCLIPKMIVDIASGVVSCNGASNI